MSKVPLTQERKNELLETCFNCYCEHGLERTGVKALAAACGCSTANLFFHFGTIDNIIIQSTAISMAKVENEFMAQAPKAISDIDRYIDEIPYWSAEHHGNKYRFMYQVYSSPKYHEYGKLFFDGVTERYTQYAKELAPNLNISWEKLQSLIFTFVRAVVHYSMFEQEEYMKSQMRLIHDAVADLRK